MTLRPRAIRRIAATLALVSFALLGGCRGMSSEDPPVHLQQNMDFQRRLDPQQPWSHFPDGRAMRQPPPGTVPRATRDFQDEHLVRGVVGGQPAAELPRQVELDRRLLSRGRERYDIFCAPCHDHAGTGRGTIVERGMLPPPSLHDDRVRAFPIGQIYDVITNGVRNMPAYRSHASVEDRWAIAAYVRALQVSRATELADVPADVRRAEGWRLADEQGNEQ